MTDIVERLRAWEPLISGGHEVPAAGMALHEAAAEIERLRSAVKRQASAAFALQANTMQTVAHLEKKDRSEYRAAATLDSEREANARLTEEIERLRTLNAEMVEALRDIGVYGCGMLNQPAALNGPEEVWLRKRIAEYEHRAHALLAKAEGGEDG